ncbi:hypothetical protein [Bacteroides sp. 519]|uniref:hypothetical protein n=1 Tax=Bacteroides sp. 519 TaxID=2302937 RepID=UPI0013D2F5B1|nr:hypothetical protein [Bacteroides sp. 519]NDV58662.1 hypothetical protein [Bacteroides sp. 519]
MVGSKQILCVLLFTIISTSAIAQNNTNSPYTRYGYGQLSDHNSIKNKGMGGAGYAVRDGLQMNLLNPASYSAVDSLTLLFEGSFTLQNTNFSNGTSKINAKNSSFDYVTMQLRLFRNLGFTMGVLPFSYVGYNLSTVVNSTDVTANQTTYTGDGSLQQAFVGLGYRVFRGLSIGANAYYLWGDINRSTELAFASTSSNYGYIEKNYLSVSDFNFDFGLQYAHRLSKKNSISLGLFYRPNKNLNNEASLTTAKTYWNDKSKYTFNTTVKDTVADFGIPATFGAGLAYTHDNRITIALDYTLEKWADEKYMDDPNAFNNKQKIALGVEILPSYIGRTYLSAIKYRFGAYYSKPNYKIKLNNESGYGSAKEYGVSFGLALPMIRSKSIVNLGAQYIKVDGKGANMLDENYLRVSIGLTFNERWFFKRKVK